MQDSVKTKFSVALRSPVTWQWIAAWTVSITALLWIAIVNGFPLLFSDSAAYIAVGAEYAVLLDRPMTYAIVIAPIFRLTSLWMVVVAQAAFTVWTIRRVLDTVLDRCSPVQFAVANIALAAFSALPWFAGQIMPDLFTPLLVLLVFLLLFGQAPLTPWERRLLPIVLMGVIAFHLSFLPLTFALIATGTLAAWWLGLWPRARRGVIAATLALVAAFTMLSTVNLVADGKFKPALMSDAFMLGRLLDAGLAQPQLADTCRQEKMGLCTLLPLIAPGRDLGKFNGKPGYFYLWDMRSPIGPLGYQNWKKIRSEESRIVGKTIAANPGPIFRMAMEGWGLQLISARSADGMFPCIECRPVIGGYVKRDWPGFLASRQQHDQLIPLAVMPVGVIAAVAAMAMLPLLYWAWRRRADRLLALGILIAVNVVSNAAVCGILTSVNDRLQARVLWLLPFFVIAATMVIWRDRAADKSISPVT